MDTHTHTRKAAYTQAHMHFYQFLADKWNRAHSETLAQLSMQQEVLRNIKEEKDKLESGAKSTRASDKDKKSKDARLVGWRALDTDAAIKDLFSCFWCTLKNKKGGTHAVLGLDGSRLCVAVRSSSWNPKPTAPS
ncbi:hypothetical protein DUNSADRAFT_2239 [Dunaliella salina]|uniref:Encoded protein n=1 Tax=Dunaliella salina TaxID=3046 RepID=A0ABQ7GVY0_DUNSA|nr:hypothetical protein DUNSADRAFT_2239 [Dunaliella salina]|eukprot:KAF5838776.1 hypothetical protein DUNSADRAFT_2239 [Dunaliella salina]